LKAVLGIFNTNLELQAKFDEWTTCKQYINQDLVKNITSYDPTARDTVVKVDAKSLASILQGKMEKNNNDCIIIANNISSECCIARFVIFPYLHNPILLHFLIIHILLNSIQFFLSIFRSFSHLFISIIFNHSGFIQFSSIHSCNNAGFR